MKRLLILFLLASTFQVSFSQWTTSGTNIYNSNTGNVGIGTTSPNWALHVHKGTSTTWDPQIVASGYNNMKLYVGTYANASSGASTKYSFIQSSEYGVTNDRFLLLNPLGGNVGIGTTSPGYKLSIDKGSGSGVAIHWTNGTYNGYNLIGSTGNIYLAADANAANSIGVNTSGVTSFYNNNALAAVINASGDVGIGTASPLGKFDLFGSGASTYSYYRGNVNAANLIWSEFADGTSGSPRICLGYRNNAGAPRRSWYIGSNSSENLFIGSRTNAWGAPGDNDLFTITNSGNVGIGTTNTQGYKLAVNGDAIFTKVKVKTYATWPDYVFYPTYKLRPLKDLEAYIKANNHLPEVPSASDVEKNGLDIGDSQAFLLKKIEELTLYIIEQDKKIENLQAQNKEWLEMKMDLEVLKQTFKTNKL